MHEPEKPHPFDLQYGVETGGWLSPVELQSGHLHDSHITAYHGTQPSSFRGGLAQWQASMQRTGHSVEEFTLVDIGCGKGRVLMLASEHPFRRVIGLELNTDIAEVARENLRRWSEHPQACRDIDVHIGDVLEFAPPPVPTLLYMYNPFDGDLFKRWAQKLAFTIQDRIEPLYLLYTYPRYEEHLAVIPGAELLWSGEIPLARDEIATDLFGCLAERVSLYCLASGGGEILAL